MLRARRMQQITLTQTQQQHLSRQPEAITKYIKIVPGDNRKWVSYQAVLKASAHFNSQRNKLFPKTISQSAEPQIQLQSDTSESTHILDEHTISRINPQQPSASQSSSIQRVPTSLFINSEHGRFPAKPTLS